MTIVNHAGHALLDVLQFLGTRHSCDVLELPLECGIPQVCTMLAVWVQIVRNGVAGIVNVPELVDLT